MSTPDHTEDDVVDGAAADVRRLEAARQRRIEHAHKIADDVETWSSKKLRACYANPETVKRAEEREALEREDAAKKRGYKTIEYCKERVWSNGDMEPCGSPITANGRCDIHQLKASDPEAAAKKGVERFNARRAARLAAERADRKAIVKAAMDATVKVIAKELIVNAISEYVARRTAMEECATIALDALNDYAKSRGATVGGRAAMLKVVETIRARINKLEGK